jgi:hypothetical protein
MKSPKIQRWIDLLAALLARRWPATFDELIRDVPAYAAGDQSHGPSSGCSRPSRSRAQSPN